MGTSRGAIPRRRATTRLPCLSLNRGCGSWTGWLDRVFADHGRRVSLDRRADAWVFPSETMKTPVSKDNCWRRHIAPKLKEVGLDWVNFQVMRRTHSTLMKHLKRDPKVVADQLGHTLDVNQNVYTQAPMELKMEAVNKLEAVLDFQ